MVHLYRLICVFFFLACTPSFAVIAPTTSYGPFSNPQYGGSYSSASAACNVYQQQQGHLGVTVSIELQSRTASEEIWKCNILNPTVGNGYALISAGSQGSSCPANSSLSGSSCVCASGYVESAGSCIVRTVNNQQNCSDAAVAASAAFGQDRITARLSSGTSLCIGNENNASGVGCRVDLLDVSITVQPNGDRYVQGFPRRTNTGADTCPVASASDPAPKTSQEVTDAPKACKGGQQATMNGVTVCQPFPAGSTVTTPKTTTTTSSTGGGVDGNSPTSSSASGQTQCVASQCTTSTTTTTTTTNADGTTSTSSSTSSKTQSQGDFCQENPKSQQCADSSWGGSCSAGFSCDGDAVMCAISQDQHKRNCALFDTASPESQLFDAEKNKAGSQVENESKSISSSSFDTSDALGGGSCIGDKQITVMGWTGSLPFSLVCAQLAILGNVLLVVSFLLAGRIVVRG